MIRELTSPSLFIQDSPFPRGPVWSLLNDTEDSPAFPLVLRGPFLSLFKDINDAATFAVQAVATPTDRQLAEVRACLQRLAATGLREASIKVPQFLASRRAKFQACLFQQSSETKDGH